MVMTTENIEKYPLSKEKSLKIFQDQIAELKRLEAESKKTVHFTEVNPDELGEEDEALYKKFQSNTLTDTELKEYILSESHNENQKRFAAYLANMLSIKTLKKYLGK